MFRGLVRADALQDMITTKKHVVQTNHHVTSAMARHVQDLEGSHSHLGRLVGKIHNDGTEQTLGEIVHVEQPFAQVLGNSSF